jgi:tRNA 2-selenouridine synthase
LPGRPQPSQKLFESRLAAALAGVDPARPLVLEAESSKIGDLFLPPALWSAMTTAPVIEVTAPLEARVRRLVDAYGGTAEDRAAFVQAFDRLPRHLPNAAIASWREMLAAGDLETLARELIEHHYDPAYARGARQRPRPTLKVVDAGTGSDADLNSAVAQVLATLPSAACGG